MAVPHFAGVRSCECHRARNCVCCVVLFNLPLVVVLKRVSLFIEADGSNDDDDDVNCPIHLCLCRILAPFLFRVLLVTTAKSRDRS